GGEGGRRNRRAGAVDPRSRRGRRRALCRRRRSVQIAVPRRGIPPRLAVAWTVQEAMAQILELVERSVADAKLALLTAAPATIAVDPKGLLQLRLGRARVGIFRSALALSGWRGRTVLNQRLHLAHR